MMFLKNCVQNVSTKLGLMHRAKLHDYMRVTIGNREVVGWGFNSMPYYIDRPDFPFPSIRWKERTPEFMALREKEKGDWRLLSLEEKKNIYRNNFCQTIVEMNAPSGDWKYIVGGGLVVITFGIWLFILMHLFIYQRFCPLPDSFKEENKRMQLRHMLDLHVNPIHGISSKWNYERDTWK